MGMQDDLDPAGIQLDNQQLDDPHQADDFPDDWHSETPEQVPSPCRQGLDYDRRDNGGKNHGPASPNNTRTDSGGTRLEVESYREGDWDLRVLLAPWCDPPEQRSAYNWAAEGNTRNWCT